MKNIFVKCGAVLLVCVLCAAMCVACGKKETEKAPVQSEVVTGSKFDVADIPDLPEDVEQSEIDKFYEEQYAKMTPEDIAQFEQDLIDLGITKEQFYSLMYAGGDGNTTTTAAVTEAAETTAAE